MLNYCALWSRPSAGVEAASSRQTMADVLGMGRLPLHLVCGLSYHTEFELPGAPGVKIELLPALHCPGDCITCWWTQKPLLPPHTFSLAICAPSLL